jgi:hypothetical protein
MITKTTSITQDLYLLEHGIDRGTADMSWQEVKDETDNTSREIYFLSNCKNNGEIPA